MATCGKQGDGKLPSAGRPKAHRRDIEHFSGCFLGGAVGDALGAPVEFMSLEETEALAGDLAVKLRNDAD